ncbi:MAG: hypothetical protein Q7S81_03415 [bacterium]|nr:hypothetical protein [bacterium]
MKIPYSLCELRIALLTLSEDKFTEKKMNELQNELAVPPVEQKDRIKAIAEYHGLIVEKLVNSPNYKVLCQEYDENIVFQLVKKMVEKFGISEKEAWALVAYVSGWLK